jgi:nitrilase
MKRTLVRIAAVQAAPIFLNKDASTRKACSLIREAAAGGATLAAFGETWLPGYPRWVNAAISATDKRHLTGMYLEQSIIVPGPETDVLCAAAKESGIDVVIGVAELDPISRGSTYCTLVFISANGDILGRHRKLKPTSGERTAWADGDATGLNVYQRPYGAISGLNCWEHNMVLPGYVLMAGGTQIHVASFPGYESNVPGTRQLLLSRAFASQGACYVILVGGLLGPNDATDPLLRDALATLPPFTGDSYIIDPSGEVIAGPAVGEQILYAEVDPDEIRRAKAMSDIGGHYSRPDLLHVVVNRSPIARVIER